MILLSKKLLGWRFKRFQERVRVAKGEPTPLKTDPIPPQTQSVRTKLVPSPGYKMNLRWQKVTETVKNQYGIDAEKEKLAKGETVTKLKR